MHSKVCRWRHIFIDECLMQSCKDLTEPWKEFEFNGSKKRIVAFIDDSSRLITCYGIFESPTTENTITVQNHGFLEYGTPREILTDHGSRFVSV